MKYFNTTLLLLACALNCYGADKSNDYYSDSYEERKITFKIKPTLIMLKTEQQQELPTPTSEAAEISPQESLPLLKYGGGIEGAATVFFTDYLSSELSLGLQAYQTNLEALKSVSYNYSDNSNYGTPKAVYGVPATATLQLHLAPFGGIHPYIGGGIMGMLHYTPSTDFEIGYGWGGVLQAGIDLCFRDESIVGLEIKHYLPVTPSVRYSAVMLGTGITGKLHLNPTIISVNFGVSF